MKAWCPNCREERQVPFQPDPDERCGVCGFRLTKAPRKDRKRTRNGGPRRDWSAARLKVQLEGVCRLGRDHQCQGEIDAAHVTGREHDPASPDPDFDLEVRPDSVLPLCRRHHKLYDTHNVDVLQVLTIDEQVRAVLDLDGIELARRRTAPTAYLPSGAVG